MASKKKFPDLTGDGKVTKKDILKGRGVSGFKDGGKVSKTAAMEDAYETKKEKKVKYARVPMEPVSGKEPDVLEDAMRYERRREGDTKTYRDGGMVRGCKGVQVSGKGFKGTY